MTVKLTTKQNLYRPQYSIENMRSAQPVCIGSWFILHSADNTGEC